MKVTWRMNEGIKGKRIMVVDDESDLTLFYKMSLEFHGFEVDTFNDPRKRYQFQTKLLQLGCPGYKNAWHGWFELNKNYKR